MCRCVPWRRTSAERRTRGGAQTDARASPPTDGGTVKISVSAERHIDAPAARVYGYLADFRDHHPRFLPRQFGDFEVETGGYGAGTVHRFTLTLGGRCVAYRVRVGEPDPGRVLIESDPEKRMLTTFTVEPESGASCRVRIETRWYTDGVTAFVERAMAPRMLRRVYREELMLLDRYVRETVPPPPARRHVHA